MKNHLKVWLIGVILFSLSNGYNTIKYICCDSKKVLGYEFNNGLVLFKQNGKYGMINKKGEGSY